MDYRWMGESVHRHNGSAISYQTFDIYSSKKDPTVSPMFQAKKKLSFKMCSSKQNQKTQKYLKSAPLGSQEQPPELLKSLPKTCHLNFPDSVFKLDGIVIIAFWASGKSMKNPAWMSQMYISSHSHLTTLPADTFETITRCGYNNDGSGG